MIGLQVTDPHFFWYLSRASGMLAYLILCASVILGLRVRTRTLGKVGVSWGAFDLHQVASLAGLGALALHILSLLGDKWFAFSLRDLLVPFASPYRPVPTALGVIALYLLVAVLASSYLRKRLSLGVWRGIHMLSFVAFGLALFHGLGAGTESAEPWARALYWLTGTVVGVLFLTRLFDPARKAKKPKPVELRGVEPLTS
ncbi:MAG: ferric reductase-like transmembrane domain-containing protein [Candidatus Limnocylindria bacterium]|nr:ferric reductase-like transmembrane domain-containing protein [Candidatus Limnocylindria bacterium]